ncbi:MAG: reverse transcriptase/maturase family protein [Candidatus Paceibacterota bacterium]|jgi:retron-type reverse transcriptase
MYNNIISLENLCRAWKEFVRGKKFKKDMAEFSLNLSRNIFKLHQDLENKTYKHGGYKSFSLRDPKPRDIHKASVRDRLLHRAVHRILYPYFERLFVYDSYSSRNFKGTHKAINRFRKLFRKMSKSNSRTCWVLKCDIRKFFASIDHRVLLDIFKNYVADEDVCWLIDKIVGSFHSFENNKGLPLGNLTSQLLANIYMNKFDQYMKHQLKIKYYVRYADDFVILSDDKNYLSNLIFQISDFLSKELKLQLHPDKVSIKTFSSGIDFLGWISFPDYRILRTSTKKRMLKRLKQHPTQETISSYLGLIKHGNEYKIREKIVNNIN